MFGIDSLSVKRTAIVFPSSSSDLRCHGSTFDGVSTTGKAACIRWLSSCTRPTEKSRDCSCSIAGFFT